MALPTSYRSRKIIRLLDRRADPFALRVSRGPGAENPGGEVVVYHATAARRAVNNLALEYAIARGAELGLPVVMLEALDEPHLNERYAAFIRSGSAGNEADAKARGVGYAFDDLSIAARARIVVGDEFPTKRAVSVAPTHVVDSNGLLPMRAMGKEQYSAKFFRDKAWKLAEEVFCAMPGYESRLSSASPAMTRLRAFIADGLTGYASGRNKSPRHVSGLSPWLHFGHVGIHEVIRAVAASGAPEEDIDAFVEEAFIRRELSFNFCFYREDHDSLGALPDWAHRTLDAHRRDRRKPVYTFEELERAATHDEVWNLSQRQLLACGTIHGYLRMLWGKKIIEWSETPEEAHAAMVRLHDRYALDGRDPNTHAGILWCFGKHDRPWAPERPIFGAVRWMSSDATVKKVRLAEIEEIVSRAETSGASARSPEASGTGDDLPSVPFLRAPSRPRR